jgi:UTP:GlnB (protein PII) uridylyltransferase
MVSMQQASLEDDDVASTLEMPAWNLVERLPLLLAAGGHSRQCCRELVARSQQELRERFAAEEAVEVLVRSRALFIDALLRTMWQHLLQPALAARTALLAVGGYGRGELHPQSDVDILILTPTAPPLDDADRSQLEQLIAFLWDIGLEVGHRPSAPNKARPT